MMAFTLFNINYFEGVLLIHLCIMGVISAEPSMHCVTFRCSLPMGFYEWVN